MQISPTIIAFKVPNETDFDDDLLNQVIRELAVGIFYKNSTPSCLFSSSEKEERTFSLIVPTAYKNTAVSYLLMKSLYAINSFALGFFCDEKSFDEWVKRPSLTSFPTTAISPIDEFSRSPMPNTCMPLIDRLKLHRLRAKAEIIMEFNGKFSKAEGIAFFEGEPHLSFKLSNFDSTEFVKIQAVLDSFSQDFKTQLHAFPELANSIRWASCIHSISTYFLHLKKQHDLPKLSKIVGRSFLTHATTHLPNEHVETFSPIGSALKFTYPSINYQVTHPALTPDFLLATIDPTIKKVQFVFGERIWATLIIPCVYFPIINLEKHPELFDLFDKEPSSSVHSIEEEPLIQHPLHQALQSHDLEKIKELLDQGYAYFHPPHDRQRRHFFVLATYLNALPIIQLLIPTWRRQKKELLGQFETHLQEAYQRLEDAKDQSVETFKPLAVLGIGAALASAAISGPSAATASLFVSSTIAATSSCVSFNQLRSQIGSIHSKIDYLRNMPFSYCPDADELTAWHAAAMRGFVEILEFLISIEPEGVHAEYGKFNTPLFVALEEAQEEAALLLANHSKINHQNEDRQTASIKALEIGFFSVADRLISRGENLNLVDNHGFDGFYYLLKYGHENQVLAQLEKGALELNRIWNGESCLAIATLYGHTRLVKALKERGAELITNYPERAIKSFIGMDLLEFVLVEWEKPDTSPAIRMKWAIYAVEFGSIHCLKRMLTDLNHLEDLTILLKNSLIHRNQESLIELLKHLTCHFPSVFDAFYIDEDESTIAHGCVAEGLIDSLPLLQEIGVPLFTVNKKGLSPFHLAILHKDLDALNRLLELTPSSFYPPNLLEYAHKLKEKNSIDLLISLKYPSDITDRSTEEDSSPVVGLFPDLPFADDDELKIAILSDLPLDYKINHTPIFEYVSEKNYSKSIDALLTRYHCLDDPERTIYERDALFAATAYDHLFVVQYLIENRQINPTVRNRQQLTPLHIAIYNNNTRIIRYLIGQMPELNCQSRSGKTPLMLSLECAKSLQFNLVSEETLHESGEKNHTSTKIKYKKTVFYSLVHKSDLSIRDKNNAMAIHYAAASNCVRELAYCISEQKEIDPKSGWDETTKTELNLPPSYYAAQYGASDALEFLFSHGANPRFAINEQGFTPLAYAAKHKNPSICQLILKFIESLSDQEQAVLFHQAVLHKNFELLSSLIERGICSGTVTDYNGKTALHMAAIGDSTKEALLLLENGVSFEQADLDGNRPLHIAATTNSIATLTLLLSQGCQVDAYNSQKQTPLHLAAKAGNRECVIHLILSGASILIPDEDGLTPAQLAYYCGHKEIAILLFIMGDVHLLKEKNDEIDQIKQLHFEQLRTKGTALHLAVLLNHFTAARLLCQIKPEYCQRADIHGLTPLDLSRVMATRKGLDKSLMIAFLENLAPTHMQTVPTNHKRTPFISPSLVDHTKLKSAEDESEELKESIPFCDEKGPLFSSIPDPVSETKEEIFSRFLTETETVRYPIDPTVLDHLYHVYAAITAQSPALKTEPMSNLKEIVNIQGALLKEDPKNREALILLLSSLREITARVRGYYPHSTQMLVILGFILGDDVRKGVIAQVKTGEGKSLIVALLAAALSAQGKYVDIVTSDLDLAARDHLSNLLFFQLAGLTSFHIDKKNKKDKKVYTASIIYGTAHEFEATILTDKLYGQRTRFIGDHERPMDIVIVDEVDNLFYEGALYSTRITTPSLFDYTWIFTRIWEKLKTSPTVSTEELQHDLLQFEKASNRVDRIIETLPISQIENWLNSAKKALYELHENENYVVEDVPIEDRSKAKGSPHQILIIDHTNTGRAQYQVRYQSGIHEFLELKHGIYPKRMSTIACCKAHVPFFKEYHQILGITGTVGEDCERKELSSVYAIERVYDVPTHHPSLRIEYPMQYLLDEAAWFEAILKQTIEVQSLGRPVLILFSNIKKTIDANMRFKKAGIQAKVLTDVQIEGEDYLLKRAGFPGQVTLATNAAGRGADIRLHPDSIRAGGLHCIVTFYSLNQRVEDQAKGRSARQGNPGSCSIICSIEDDFIHLLFPESKEKCKDVEHILRALPLLRKHYTKILSETRLREIPNEILTDSISRDFYPEIEKIREEAKRFNETAIEEIFTSFVEKKIPPIKTPLGNAPDFSGESVSMYQILDNIRFNQSIDWKTINRIVKQSFINTLLKQWGSFFESIQQKQVDASLPSRKLYEDFVCRVLQPPKENFRLAISNYVQLMLAHGAQIDATLRKMVFRARLHDRFYNRQIVPIPSVETPHAKKIEWMMNFAYALSGDSKAQIQIGDAYANGKNVQKNRQIAIQYYQAAAIQGDAAARLRLAAFSIPNAMKKPFTRVAVLDDPFDSPQNTCEFACWLNQQKENPHAKILSFVLLEKTIREIQIAYNKKIAASYDSLSFSMKDWRELRIKYDELDTTQTIYRELKELYVQAFECIKNPKSTPKEKWIALFNAIISQFKTLHPKSQFGLKEDLSKLVSKEDLLKDPKLATGHIESIIEENLGDQTPIKSLKSFILHVISSCIPYYFSLLARKPIPSDFDPLNVAFRRGLIAFFTQKSFDLNLLKLLMHFEKLQNLKFSTARLMKNHLLRCIAKYAKENGNFGYAYGTLIELGYYPQKNHQEAAFKAFEQAMLLGDRNAAFEVYERYQIGLGVTPNPETANKIAFEQGLRKRKKEIPSQIQQLIKLHDEMIQAVCDDNVSKVEELFSLGASRNFVSQEGLTLLGCSMHKKAYRVLKLLFSSYGIKELNFSVPLEGYIAESTSEEETELRAVCRSLGLNTSTD